MDGAPTLANKYNQTLDGSLNYASTSLLRADAADSIKILKLWIQTLELYKLWKHIKPKYWLCGLELD